MSENLSLGSLFDGISGFPLAGRECGIQTKWLCEIEPYPRLVSFSRFPEAKQYGDINKLDGAEVAPVDIITFGSPCQSFSVAGARAGLDGESGLFFQAVRVIREMRKATNNAFPRYAIMENVPGIYSSKSSGKSDFGVVLNELIKLCDETVTIPEPEKSKFLTAGAVVGDGYSLAWRTLCASQFGVAQRRRRMFLVVSFADERAAEILSEQAGEGRDFTPGYRKGQDAARTAAAGSGSVIAFEPGALKRIDKSCWEDQARTLRADCGDNHQAVAYPLDLRNAVRTGGSQGTGVGGADAPSYTVTAEYTHGVCAVENHPQDARLRIREDGKYPAVTQRFGSGGGNTHFVLDERKQCAPVTEDMVGALTATDYKGAPVLCLEGNGQRPSHKGSGVKEGESFTLDATQHHAVCYQETVGALCASDWRGIRNQDIGDEKAVVETTGQTLCFGNNGFGKWNNEDVRTSPAATLKASGGDFPGAENLAVENKYAVRRLTPLECLRLQGYPDWWLDGFRIAEPTEADISYWRGVWAELGKKKSDKQLAKWLKDPYGDSNAYKAIGNSLAVPCALFVLRGITENACVQ